MSGTTILIYGADQPFGRRLNYYLTGYAIERNRPVTCVVKSGAPGTQEEIQKDLWSTYTGEHGTQRPTHVVNAYRLESMDRLEYDKELGFTHNTHPTARVALAARGAGIPLIHISTDQVFRGTKGPYADDADPWPVNMYGLSMRLAEKAAVAFHPMTWPSGAEYPVGAFIVRLSWIYGREVASAPRVTSGATKQK
ncbi:unnamed protein product, partial [marine sediment metagenome]